MIVLAAAAAATNLNLTRRDMNLQSYTFLFSKLHCRVTRGRCRRLAGRGGAGSGKAVRVPSLSRAVHFVHHDLKSWYPKIS